MQIRFAVTLAISLLLLGASYAFAGGMINDAATIRAHGGVGNYLFWSMRDTAAPSKGKNELVNHESLFERAPTLDSNGVEEFSILQSSVVVPTQTLTFPRGSARILADEKARLDEIASMLKSDPALKVQVTGYTDNEGSALKNHALARARAEAVINGLKMRGASENQLSRGAKGESDPVSENDTAEGRAQNRRVEIQFE